MTIDARQETARIYQFPAKPHVIGRSHAGRATASTERQASRTPTADFGSGWYHDAAIQKDTVVPHAG